MPSDPPRIAIVCARQESERIGRTLDALAAAMPGLELIVADDASDDGTDHIARARGASVVRGARPSGKGENATRAAESVLARVLTEPAPTILLCDADLGDSAAGLVRLCEEVESGACDVAIAAFRRRLGGGFGLAVEVARRAIHDLCGFEATAPLSGQRALRGRALWSVVPFAHGFGMEVAMTSDLVRAGWRVRELELDLEHRATGRTPAGFAHRARQVAHIARAWSSRRFSVG